MLKLYSDILRSEKERIQKGHQSLDSRFTYDGCGYRRCLECRVLFSERVLSCVKLVVYDLHVRVLIPVNLNSHESRIYGVTYESIKRELKTNLYMSVGDSV